MNNWIRQFFAPPTYADPRQDRLAKQLHLLLLLGIGMTSIYAPLVYLATQDTAGPIASGCMFFVTVVFVWLLKNGRLYLVSSLIIGISYAAIMLSLTFNGGIRDQAIVTLIMLLTLAALFLGERFVVFLGLLSSLILTVLYAAERMGIIVDPDYNVPSQIDDLLTSLIAIIITTVFLQQMIRQAGNSDEQIRQQAEMLQAQNDTLEQNRQSLQLRTQELTTTLVNLESARAAAEQASQAKSEFLSSMSHELRTPLNGILGFAQILLRQSQYEPESTQEALTIIQQSGEHLLTLITDILDLAKIEAGKLELVPEPFHLSHFLLGIVALMQPRAREKGLCFDYQPDAALPTAVIADAKRLRQVLINLLSNAIKFTSAGSVALRVTLLTQDETAAMVRFAVVDTGIGIAADDLVRIFHPFEQAGSMKTKMGGTGLGLAISQQLVALSDGMLMVNSTPGAGSHFWFDLALPLTAASAVITQRPFTPITGYQGPRRTVLAIDDIASNRAVLIALLKPLGFVVQEAEDGETAVSLATAQPPDVIFTDLLMPGLSGQETIARLRQQPALAQTPILVMSANATAANGHVAQANAFLTKPLDTDLVLQQLQQLLGLVWTTEEVGTETAVEPTIVLPSPADLTKLHDLALMGDLTAVGTYAAQLSQANTALNPFAEQIQQLTQSFEEEQLIQTLKTYQQTGYEPKQLP